MFSWSINIIWLIKFHNFILTNILTFFLLLSFHFFFMFFTVQQFVTSGGHKKKFQYSAHSFFPVQTHKCTYNFYQIFWCKDFRLNLYLNLLFFRIFYTLYCCFLNKHDPIACTKKKRLKSLQFVRWMVSLRDALSLSRINLMFISTLIWIFSSLLPPQVFKDYFGELEEESIRDNFVVVYELLDETMDFGYPQTCESKILRE